MEESRFDRSPRAPRSRPVGRWIPPLLRFILRVFFQRIEVIGGQRIPRGAPLLYAANHNNGVVDPLLVMGYLPGRPRFLAKSTLWNHPAARPFLNLGGVIPVFRRQDAGFDRERNLEAFTRCEEVLAAGGAVALFPEGISHAGPALAELRSGAARIALGAEKRYGPLGLYIVPVGLVYDAQARFRSQVLVKVGESFLLGDVDEVGGGEVKRVTRRLSDALREVTPDYPSWEEGRLLERAVDVYLHPEPELPVAMPMPERFLALRAFLEGYRRFQRERPGRLTPLASAMRNYDRMLVACRLRDIQVGAGYPLPQVAGFTARSLLLLFVLLPLATVGTVLHLVPFRICGWLGARVAREPERPATHMLIAGVVLFPLTWAVAIGAAWWWGGVGAALAAALLAPLGGYGALRFRDRLLLLVSEARAYLLLRRTDRLKERLETRRRALRRELLSLVEEYRSWEDGT